MITEGILVIVKNSNVSSEILLPVHLPLLKNKLCILIQCFVQMLTFYYIIAKIE